MYDKNPQQYLTSSSKSRFIRLGIIKITQTPPPPKQPLVPEVPSPPTYSGLHASGSVPYETSSSASLCRSGTLSRADRYVDLAHDRPENQCYIAHGRDGIRSNTFVKANQLAADQAALEAAKEDERQARALSKTHFVGELHETGFTTKAEMEQADRQGMKYVKSAVWGHEYPVLGLREEEMERYCRVRQMAACSAAMENRSACARDKKRIRRMQWK